MVSGFTKALDSAAQGRAAHPGLPCPRACCSPGAVPSLPGCAARPWAGVYNAFGVKSERPEPIRAPGSAASDRVGLFQRLGAGGQALLSPDPLDLLHHLVDDAAVDGDVAVADAAGPGVDEQRQDGQAEVQR